MVQTWWNHYWALSKAMLRIQAFFSKIVSGLLKSLSKDSVQASGMMSEGFCILNMLGIVLMHVLREHHRHRDCGLNVLLIYCLYNQVQCGLRCDNWQFA